MDINSFADYYLVQTIVGNTEMSSVYSVYCYKKRNGKLYAGPLWDFDLSAFASENGTTNSKSIWYKYMLKDPIFVEVLKTRFRELKPRIDEWFEPYVKAQAARLQPSMAENWRMWEIDLDVLYNRLNGDETLPYDEAVERMISKHKARIAWLEQYIENL